MKELQLEFIGKGEVRGFKFKQLLKSDKGYLYEVTDEGQKHFEVFPRHENEYYQTVTYPKSNSFSIWAWSFRSYEKALGKYYTLKDEPC